MRDWIELESLHVVSDLHLGGREGFQIFGSTAELAWLIDRVAAAPQPDRHGLLINGDIIDFLAEEPSVLFDPDGAVAKLDCVWQRFEPVFAALQRLLMTPHRLLIINLGNHDLELALPWVRAHLAQRLTEGDEAATARLLWVTDGTGVRCRVGKASVVCVHGNEVDSWNVTDYERLRRIGRDRQFGLPVRGLDTKRRHSDGHRGNEPDQARVPVRRPSQARDRRCSTHPRCAETGDSPQAAGFGRNCRTQGLGPGAHALRLS